MPMCVEVVGQYLQLATDQTQPCAHYVILTGQEYSTLPTLADVFSIPLATDLQALFALGFSLPLVAYLAAWAYQAVINFASEK